MKRDTKLEANPTTMTPTLCPAIGDGHACRKRGITQAFLVRQTTMLRLLQLKTPFDGSYRKECVRTKKTSLFLHENFTRTA